MQAVGNRLLSRTNISAHRTISKPLQSFPFVIRHALPTKRPFSFNAMYPTPSESAAMEDRHEKAISRMVCGKCNTTLCSTRDLVFFKWRNGIHVSSLTDETLKNLFPEDTVTDKDVNWKKHKMLCIKCNHQVGTLARVFSSDKVLFGASCVAVQMPEEQSPLLSMSGYPSSLLNFSMWSELILMAETQPMLKELLQIRRVDNIQQDSTNNAELSRKFLMAKDLQELLRVVDENALELNPRNIRTAIDRAGRFVATRTTRATLKTVRSTNKLGKSEAPEDGLLAVPSPALFKNWSATPDTLDTERFWKLVDETEKLVNFGIAAFRTGRALLTLTTALMRLGVGRQTILQPIAAQTVYMMQIDKPKVTAYEASMIVTAIVHLLSRENRKDDWVLDLLHATCKMVMTAVHEKKESAEDSQRPSEILVLISLARSFMTADNFDADLFRHIFNEVNSGVLDRLSGPPHKSRALKSKVYQLHLDCVLNRREQEFRLSPALETEYKYAFDAHEKRGKSSSFRLHHLVGTALDEIGIPYESSYALDSGYHFDVAVPRQNIAIEINSSDCYQIVEPGDQDKHPRTFGFVDLKTRHLELLGWTVIDLHADRFSQLETLEDRVMHLSMLLEVAACRDQKFTGELQKKIRLQLQANAT